MERLELINMILGERRRQDELHPRNDWDAVVWATVLGEEYGEVCRAILDHDAENLKDELVQLAAVCLRICENLDDIGLFYES